MPIWGWVCSGLVVLAVVGGIGTLVWEAIQRRRYERDADEVIGWVVHADVDLYASDRFNDGTVWVLVNFDSQPGELDAETGWLAGRVAELKGRVPRTDDEKAIVAFLRGTGYQPSERLLLPAALTGGRAVYLLTVSVKREWLPDKVLSRPFVRCLLFRDKPDTRTLIARYQASDADFQLPDEPATSELPAPPPPPSSDELRPAFVTAARAAYSGGYSRKYARKKLLEAGCPEESVDAVVEQAWQEYVGEQRQMGFAQVGCGVLLLVVGIGITVAVARQVAEGGGTYVIMTGAIVVGAWNLFRGTVRAIGGR